MWSSITQSSVPSGAPAGAPAPSFPELYERLLVGPLFTPWAERLLDGMALAPGSRVLDVACGTGIVARLAAERLGAGARVVGVDRTPPMLAVARAVAPEIDWREGDAAELPVGEDETFDAVVCHQGLQFFADRLAAVREMRRVLAPGGRVGIGVWRSREENGLWNDLDIVAQRFVGHFDDVRHGFTDEDALARLLIDAGFQGVEVTPTTLETRFEIEPAALARLNAGAVVGMTPAGKAMSEAERAALVERIVDASLPEVERYRSGGVIAFPTSANIANGRA